MSDVYTIAPPHARVPIPARPCAECGWACQPGRWTRRLCPACYRRRCQPSSRAYYRPGTPCQACGLVPRTTRRGRGLTRGLCHACYQTRWRAAQGWACGDCGARVSARGLRCRSCVQCARRRGPRPVPRCADCGTTIHRESMRCRPCAVRWRAQARRHAICPRCRALGGHREAVCPAA